MPQTGLEHFSVDLPKERARRQYGDRCGRSRFRRAQRDGCDPAAIPNAENAEATQGKSLKNALAARRLRIRCLYAKARWRRVICKKRFGARTVVKDISLEVKSGEIVGLLGPNGAGKTTSFYMMVGLIPLDAGQIT